MEQGVHSVILYLVSTAGCLEFRDWVRLHLHPPCLKSADDPVLHELFIIFVGMHFAPWPLQHICFMLVAS